MRKVKVYIYCHILNRTVYLTSFTLYKDEDANTNSNSTDDDSNSEVAEKKRKIHKNPDVDTSFLPDRDREEEENRLREELRQVTIVSSTNVHKCERHDLSVNSGMG